MPCLLAAIQMAIGAEHTGQAGVDAFTVLMADETAVRDVIEEQYGTRKIPEFNDNPSTTFEMVEAVLEKAILNRGGSL